MPDYRFVRLCRTNQSEAFEILENDEPAARVDLHYTSSIVHASLMLERELDDDAIQNLIEVIDAEIIDSADTPREDLLVTVYAGRQVGIYSDDAFDDDHELEDEAADEEPETSGRNGHR